MDYIKRNHLSLLIILWLLVSAALGLGRGQTIVERVIQQSGNDDGLGASIDNATSTISNPFVFEQGIVVGTTNGTRVIKQNGSDRSLLRQAMVTSTTTACSLAVPRGANILKEVMFDLTTSTSTATIWRIASSTTAYGTTTVFMTEPVAANGTRTYSWVPTTTTQAIFKAGQYINIDASGGAGGTPGGGVCVATFDGI